MLFEKLLSASDLPLSENVAYSSAHVETLIYSEAYDTLEQDYATVAAACKQNIFSFFFWMLISSKQYCVHIVQSFYIFYSGVGR